MSTVRLLDLPPDLDSFRMSMKKVALPPSCFSHGCTCGHNIKIRSCTLYPGDCGPSPLYTKNIPINLHLKST